MHMHVDDIQYGINVASIRLELAFLYFFNSFRKVYVGEHYITSSKVRHDDDDDDDV